MNDPQKPNDFQAQPPQVPAPSGNNTASRLKRFWAAMIDCCIQMMVAFPVFNHFGVWDTLKNQQEISPNLANGLAVFGLALFFVLHGYLLYQYGQTIGKRIMGLAIVTLDGKKPHFPTMILGRYLPQWVVGFLPGVGPLLAIVDVVFIFFNNQNRCVHDLIARTKVIDLSIKVAAKPDSIIA